MGTNINLFFSIITTKLCSIFVFWFYLVYIYHFTRSSRCNLFFTTAHVCFEKLPVSYLNTWTPGPAGRRCSAPSGGWVNDTWCTAPDEANAADTSPARTVDNRNAKDCRWDAVCATWTCCWTCPCRSMLGCCYSGFFKEREYLPLNAESDSRHFSGSAT